MELNFYCAAGAACVVPVPLLSCFQLSSIQRIHGVARARIYCKITHCNNDKKAAKALTIGRCDEVCWRKACERLACCGPLARNWATHIHMRFIILNLPKYARMHVCVCVCTQVFTLICPLSRISHYIRLYLLSPSFQLHFLFRLHLN